jgi:hypothetical protein
MNQGTSDVASPVRDHPGSEALNLQQFCGTDPSRDYLMKPFSRDGFTWATNGHILIRVPERPEFSDIEQRIKINIAEPLKGFGVAKFFSPSFELPPATVRGECLKCAGRGHLHDCPDCDCECEHCDGTGNSDSEQFASVSIGPTPFALNYVRQILSLPRVEIEEFAAEQSEKCLFFRFDGGVGALMPLRRESEDHVDIKLRSV